MLFQYEITVYLLFSESLYHKPSLAQWEEMAVGFGP